MEMLLHTNTINLRHKNMSLEFKKNLNLKPYNSTKPKVGCKYYRGKKIKNKNFLLLLSRDPDSQKY
jgi:hypothetical protein